MAIDINIPSQVKNYANLAAFPATGSLKTIFIAEDTNKTYRWTGSAYVEISASQATAWGAITGTLSAQTDLNTALSGKVPTTRTLTINGTTQDLSADRTFTISTGITIGTTAITSGTVGRVLFEGTGNVVQESAGITWDNTNAVFSLGTLANKIINFKPADTSSIFGNTSSIRGGISGRIDFLNGSNLTHIYDGTVIVGPTAGPYIQVGSTSIAFAIGGTERARFAATTGNVLINTTTDAGFKVDINGTSVFRGTLGLISTTAIQLAVTTNGNTRILSNNNDIILNAGSSTIEHSFGTYSIRKRMLTTYGDANANAGVAIGVDAINVASAILSAESTTKGFLPPRMTTTQKNAIASPATGLLVYDTTLNLISVYNGTTWITL
jgi:hypothetical protein